MHKSQVFFYLLSAFITGVFFASIFEFSVSIVLVMAVGGVAITALSFKNRYGMLAGFFILVFSAGITRFNYYDSQSGSLVDMAGREVAITGYINSEPEIEGNRARFVLSAEGERVLITTNAFPRRGFGNKLEVKGELELPQNPTDFDYVTYLKKDGIRTIIFYPKEIKESAVNLKLGEKIKVTIYRNIFVFKNRFEHAVNLSISEPNAAFINGILLGTRQNIPDDLKGAFSKTGTTHILAISGYNIMIISWAVLGGLIWFFRRRVAFWISVGVIILFVILTGASASVVRAAVMGLLLSFAHGYGRLYDQKNSIILAGAVMIWFNPMVLVFDIGFQLSFVAVLGLIYIFPWFDHVSSKIPEWGKIKELTLMTLSAQLAVAPLLIYHFGGVSAVSLPANILILPLVPMAMLTGFIAGLTGMFIPVVGQLVGYIAWAITSYQIEVVKYLTSFII